MMRGPDLSYVVTTPNYSTKTSAAGVSFIKGYEQVRLLPYDDQTGKTITQHVRGATIGYGHLIPATEWDRFKNGIAEVEAERLFATDLAPYERTVASSVRCPLTQYQFDALVSLAFNIGRGGLASSSVVKLVNDPNAKTPYANLEAAWKAWNKSQGVVIQGLINRRQDEWEMYTRADYKRDH